MNRYTILHNGEDTHVVVIATNAIRAKEKLDEFLKHPVFTVVDESKVCKVSNCDKIATTKYMCSKHYQEFK